jgi:Zn-dependent protease
MTEAADALPPKTGISPLGLAVVALWLALGAALLATAKPPHLLLFAFVMVGWMLSVMVHEFGHALVGWLAGDHTVKLRGYLDFDPRRYGDPVTSLGIPLLALALGGIGFPGGAVYLRTDLMRSRLWRAAASLAGPAATAAILLLLVLALRLWAAAGAIDSELFPALTLLAFLQAMALVLNLLPIPGLDGFNGIRPFLPKSWGPGLAKADRLGMLLLLALVFLVPGAGGALFRAAAWLSLALGLQGEALQYGWSAFFFWRH